MKAPKSDKNKIVMLGAMGVLLLGVGAFQFIGSGAPAPAPKKTEEGAAAAAAAAAAPTTPPKSDNVFAEMPLAQRDPFAPQIAPKVDPNAVGQNTPAPPSPRGLNPMDVGAPPMPPMPGGVEGLPQPQPGENTGNGASIASSEPSLRLSGVVIGDRPIALIQTEGGKQRTVKVGDTVSGQKVTSISRRGVVLVGNGQRTTLSLKGNAENIKSL